MLSTNIITNSRMNEKGDETPNPSASTFITDQWVDDSTLTNTIGYTDEDGHIDTLELIKNENSGEAQAYYDAGAILQPGLYLSFWFKLESVGLNNRFWARIFDSTDFISENRIINMNVDYGMMNLFDGTNWVSTGVTLEENTWTHILINLVSTTKIDFYVNQVFIGQYDIDHAFDSSQCIVRMTSGLYTLTYDSFIDETYVGTNATEAWQSAEIKEYKTAHTIPNAWTDISEYTNDISYEDYEGHLNVLRLNRNENDGFCGATYYAGDLMGTDLYYSFWFKVEESNVDDLFFARLFDDADLDAGTNSIISMHVDETHLEIYETSAWTNTGIIVADDTWYHVMFHMKSSSAMDFFFNGELIGEYGYQDAYDATACYPAFYSGHYHLDDGFVDAVYVGNSKAEAWESYGILDYKTEKTILNAWDDDSTLTNEIEYTNAEGHLEALSLVKNEYNGYAKALYDAGTILQDDFYFSFWVNLEETNFDDAFYAMIIDNTEDIISDTIIVLCVEFEELVVAENVGVSTHTGFTVSDNTWYHFMVHLIDSTTIEVFANGHSVGLYETYNEYDSSTCMVKFSSGFYHTYAEYMDAAYVGTSHQDAMESFGAMNYKTDNTIPNSWVDESLYTNTIGYVDAEDGHLDVLELIRNEYNGYTRTTYDAGTILAPNFYYSFWFKLENANVDDIFYARIYDDSGLLDEDRVINMAVEYGVIELYNGNSWVSTGITTTSNTWNHVMLNLKTTTEIDFYYNGEYVGEFATDQDSYSTTCIVQFGGGAYHYYEEFIDAVYVGNSEVEAMEPFYQLATPSLDSLPSSDDDGDFTVSWSRVLGGGEYILYRDTNPISDISSLTPVYQGIALEYSESGLAEGDYYYRVMTQSTTTHSELSVEEVISVIVSEEEFLDAPILILPESDDDGDFWVSWNTVQYATGYRLYRETTEFSSADGLTAIYIGADIAYLLSDQPEGEFFFGVVAYNATCESTLSIVKSVLIEFPRLDSPILDDLPSIDNDGIFIVSWSEVVGASGYRLYASHFQITEIGELTPVYDGGDLFKSFIDVPEGEYFFRVLAYGSLADSLLSNEEFIEVEIFSLDAPILNPITDGNNDGSYNVAWTAVEGAEGYRLYRSSSPIVSLDGLSPIYEGIAIQYAESDKAPGTYYYRVLVYGSETTSPLSNQKSITIENNSTPNPPINQIDGYSIPFLFSIMIISLGIVIRKRNHLYN